jgi:hypothetical protein
VDSGRFWSQSLNLTDSGSGSLAIAGVVYDDERRALLGEGKGGRTANTS